MRKVIVALGAILLGSMFAPAASALPVFARQTGFACSQCHFQHFPLLNAFGRSFKNSGFTLVGAQPKVESDNLSIPDRLNFGGLTSVGFENVSNGTPGGLDNSINTPAGGGELSLFYGGKISDNIGFLSELGVAGPAATGSAKMPILYEVSEGTRAGLVFMSTDGQGAAYSFETLNTGAVGVHKLNVIAGQAAPAHLTTYSASQYLGTATPAQGISFVVNSDNYFINVGKYAVPWKANSTASLGYTTGTAADLGTATKGGNMRMTYARAATMFDVAGYEAAVGVQSFSGDDGRMSDGTGTNSISGVVTGTKATIIDGQLQGQIDDHPVGLYVSYGVAPTVPSDGITQGNVFNAKNVVDARTFNVGAEYGILPNVLSVMAGFRMANNGDTVDGTTGTDKLTDNSMMVGITYALAMNVQASLSYTAQSGTAWDPANNKNNAGVEAPGKTITSIMMMAVF